MLVLCQQCTQHIGRWPSPDLGAAPCLCVSWQRKASASRGSKEEKGSQLSSKRLPGVPVTHLILTVGYGLTFGLAWRSNRAWSRGHKAVPFLEVDLGGKPPGCGRCWVASDGTERGWAGERWQQLRLPGPSLPF